MNNQIQQLQTLLPAFFAGVLLGSLFFYTLWFTTKKGLLSTHLAHWFIGGLLLRMGIALSGFYLIANDDWRRLALCILGFIIGRMLIYKLVVFKPSNRPSLIK
jgi:F1F0 ATPase subunit 2